MDLHDNVQFFKILIIEDDEEDLLLLTELLANITDIDYELSSAGSLTAATQMLQEREYDIILLDLGLPESSGLATIDKFIELEYKAAVIVMTGLDDNEFAQTSLARGMHDYLVKGNIDPIILSRSIRYAVQRNLISRDLLEREHYYRSLIAKLHEDIIVIAKDFTITDINNTYLQTTGLHRSEVIGKKCYQITHGKEKPCSSVEHPCKLKEVFQSGEPAKCLHLHKNNDGSERFVDIILSPLKDKDGNVMQVIEAARDITDYYKLNEQLQKSLQEKEILLAEVHHRVKNNMQLISSLLRMETHRIKNAEALDCLQDSRNRVRSMSLIHDRLYVSQDFTNVEIEKYIGDLARDFYRIYDIKPEKVELKTRIGKFDLNINLAIPCGLIINELLSNAFKYAFPNDESGKIEIDFIVADEGTYKLVVKDNGVGMPAGFDIEQAETLGLRLVRNLTQQLHGTLHFANAGGTEFIVEFKEN